MDFDSDELTIEEFYEFFNLNKKIFISPSRFVNIIPTYEKTNYNSKEIIFGDLTINNRLMVVKNYLLNKSVFFIANKGSKFKIKISKEFLERIFWFIEKNKKINRKFLILTKNNNAIFFNYKENGNILPKDKIFYLLDDNFLSFPFFNKKFSDDNCIFCKENESFKFFVPYFLIKKENIGNGEMYNIIQKVCNNEYMHYWFDKKELEFRGKSSIFNITEYVFKEIKIDNNDILPTLTNIFDEYYPTQRKLLNLLTEINKNSKITNDELSYLINLIDGLKNDYNIKKKNVKLVFFEKIFEFLLKFYIFNKNSITNYIKLSSILINFIFEESNQKKKKDYKIVFAQIEFYKLLITFESNPSQVTFENFKEYLKEIENPKYFEIIDDDMKSIEVKNNIKIEFVKMLFNSLEEKYIFSEESYEDYFSLLKYLVEISPDLNDKPLIELEKNFSNIKQMASVTGSAAVSSETFFKNVNNFHDNLLLSEMPKSFQDNRKQVILDYVKIVNKKLIDKLITDFSPELFREVINNLIIIKEKKEYKDLINNCMLTLSNLYVKKINKIKEGNFVFKEVHKYSLEELDDSSSGFITSKKFEEFSSINYLFGSKTVMHQINLLNNLLPKYTELVRSIDILIDNFSPELFREVINNLIITKDEKEYKGLINDCVKKLFNLYSKKNKEILRKKYSNFEYYKGLSINNIDNKNFKTINKLRELGFVSSILEIEMILFNKKFLHLKYLNNLNKLSYKGNEYDLNNINNGSMVLLLNEDIEYAEIVKLSNNGKVEEESFIPQVVIKVTNYENWKKIRDLINKIKFELTIESGKYFNKLYELLFKLYGFNNKLIICFITDKKGVLLKFNKQSSLNGIEYFDIYVRLNEKTRIEKIKNINSIEYNLIKVRFKTENELNEELINEYSKNLKESNLSIESEKEYLKFFSLLLKNLQNLNFERDELINVIKKLTEKPIDIKFNIKNIFSTILKLFKRK